MFQRAAYPPGIPAEPELNRPPFGAHGWTGQRLMRGKY
jgi:hypothetical protein